MGFKNSGGLQEAAAGEGAGDVVSVAEVDVPAVVSRRGGATGLVSRAAGGGSLLPRPPATPLHYVHICAQCVYVLLNICLRACT